MGEVPLQGRFQKLEVSRYCPVGVAGTSHGCSSSCPAQRRGVHRGQGYRGYSKLRTRTALGSYSRPVSRSIGPP